jgi:hypothetical protein
MHILAARRPRSKASTLTCPCSYASACQLQRASAHAHLHARIYGSQDLNFPPSRSRWQKLDHSTWSCLQDLNQQALLIGCTCAHLPYWAIRPGLQRHGAIASIFDTQVPYDPAGALRCNHHGLWCIGANDVANAFATSVTRPSGSGVVIPCRHLRGAPSSCHTDRCSSCFSAPTIMVSL